MKKYLLITLLFCVSGYTLFSLTNEENVFFKYEVNLLTPSYFTNNYKKKLNDSLQSDTNEVSKSNTKNLTTLKENTDYPIYNGSVKDKSYNFLNQSNEINLSNSIGYFEIVWKNNRYGIFVASRDSHRIQTHLQNVNGNQFYGFAEVKDFLIKKKSNVLMLTNGGMYKPNFKPVGYFRELGGSDILYPLDIKKPNLNDNFHLYPNGVFYVDLNGNSKVIETDKFNNDKQAKQAKIATQSGPMLVFNGKIHPKFTKGSTNKKIRSGVGVSTQGNTIFIISKGEVSFYDFADLFLNKFSCSNALYLDGQISQMQIEGKGLLPPKRRQFGPMISVVKK
jgi:uncharacterized protein YigE (DUF2233 family)